MYAIFKLPRRNGNIAVDIAARVSAPDEYALPLLPAELTAVNGSGNNVGLSEFAYQDQDGHVTPRSPADIDQAIQAGRDQLAARAARATAIDNAQLAAGLKQLSIAQGEAYIDNQIDNATTVPEIKAAIKGILKKMLPYLLS